jgi:hypothetical protein
LAEPLFLPEPSRQRRVVPPGGPADVIELIMTDHRRIRRLCQALDDAVRWQAASGPGWLPAHAWERLSAVLDSHTRAEEEICYLPMFGCLPRAAEARRDAVADHDDIREAVSEACLQRAGSLPWWRAVRAAVAASIDHLDREESGVLAEFPYKVTITRRCELGRQWSAFVAASRLDAVPRGSRPGGYGAAQAGAPGRGRPGR